MMSMTDWAKSHKVIKVKNTVQIECPTEEDAEELYHLMKDLFPMVAKIYDSGLVIAPIVMVKTGEKP